jgi:DNA-binding GntR family transcriptional regulator
VATPGQRAEAAVKASPDKSDVLIAKEIGVSHETVRQARNRSTANGLPVEKRTGKGWQGAQDAAHARQLEQMRQLKRSAQARTAGQEINCRISAS